MGPKTDLSIVGKKVLVTGGGGFVGKAVVKQLIKAGVETCIVSRNYYPDVEKLGAESIVGNICDQNLLDKITQDVVCVIHVAALAGIWGEWSDYYGSNVIGTQNVIESCLKNEVFSLVYTSTPSVVFDRSDILGGNENLPYANSFLCHYARSKVIAEKMILQANCPKMFTCALRPHLIWGPGDPHLLPRLIEKGRKKQLKRVGDGTNIVDISYVDNVAHAHVLAAENLKTTAACAGKAYFVSQGEPVNLWDWINTLFAAMDIPPVKQADYFSSAYRVGSLLELVYQGIRVQKEPPMTRFIAEQLAKSHFFSIENSRNDFGYEPLVTTEEGLVRSINWFKNK